MELKPFDKHDWNAFAGAEGDAHIGYTDKLTIIADDAGIFVMITNSDDDDCWVLSTPNAKVVASMIAFELLSDAKTLEAIGFEKVN